MSTLSLALVRSRLLSKPRETGSEMEHTRWLAGVGGWGIGLWVADGRAHAKPRGQSSRTCRAAEAGSEGASREGVAPERGSGGRGRSWVGRRSATPLEMARHRGPAQAELGTTSSPHRRACEDTQSRKVRS